MKITRRAIVLIFAAIIMAAPVNFNVAATPIATYVTAQPSININSYFSMTKAQRGRSLQAAVVMDIPGGYHVNSNRPSGKYLIPTSLKLDPRDGVSVGGVRYPRATLRNFSFSETRLSVFEGRAVMRFSVAIPSNFPQGKLELKAKVRYQSCSNKECYAPVSRDVSLWIDVVNANESSQRTNSNIFGK